MTLRLKPRALLLAVLLLAASGSAYFQQPLHSRQLKPSLKKCPELYFRRPEQARKFDDNSQALALTIL
jgi:hypothetical protein